MMAIRLLKSVLFVSVLLIASTLNFGESFAHCDTLDGPVIAAAREALKTGDIKPVLAWVQPGDEPYMRGVFEKTIAVRKLSPEARDFADVYFFETLVRIHRAGEGAPYTGLKPAGQVEPGVAIADKAIENGSPDQLVREMNGLVAIGIQERFKKLMDRKKHANESVGAGREYVASYVEFVHYVEALHGSAVAGGAEHGLAEATQDHKAVHEHK